MEGRIAGARGKKALLASGPGEECKWEVRMERRKCRNKSKKRRVSVQNNPHVGGRKLLRQTGGAREWQTRQESQNKCDKENASLRFKASTNRRRESGSKETSAYTKRRSYTPCNFLRTKPFEAILSVIIFFFLCALECAE